MTPVQLVESLGEELKTITGHIRLPSQYEKESGINIFKFGLPLEKTNEDRGEKFPYILLTIEEGGIKGEEAQIVSVRLLIGIYDDGMENQGKYWVLNIINDICERFLKNPVLEGECYADDEIVWVVDDKVEYPYHYGAVRLIFNIPAFRRESEYA